MLSSIISWKWFRCLILNDGSPRYSFIFADIMILMGSFIHMTIIDLSN